MFMAQLKHEKKKLNIRIIQKELIQTPVCKPMTKLCKATTSTFMLRIFQRLDKVWLETTAWALLRSFWQNPTWRHLRFSELFLQSLSCTRTHNTTHNGKLLSKSFRSPLIRQSRRPALLVSARVSRRFSGCGGALSMSSLSSAPFCTTCSWLCSSLMYEHFLSVQRRWNSGSPAG